jgi:ribosomal protein L37E
VNQAVCWKCGFKMMVRGAAPKACPKCGFTESDRVRIETSLYTGHFGKEKSAPKV